MKQHDKGSGSVSKPASKPATAVPDKSSPLSSQKPVIGMVSLPLFSFICIFI